MKPENMNIKIFADGANLDEIRILNKNDLVKGFTTNPTLMRKAGVKDYKAFALSALDIVDGKPISFEVFVDDLAEMERQALEVSSWGKNIFVKIPVTNTKGDTCVELIRRLAGQGVKINVTAVFTLDQTVKLVAALNPDVAAYISIFAGRVADAGQDPVPLMKSAVEMLNTNPNAELIWASPRELYNIIQAESVGCQIITVTKNVIEKLQLFGKDLDQFSLETVKMFYNDADEAGYKIKIGSGIT